MLTVLRSLLVHVLSPPVFPGDEEKTTAAIMIHYGILFGAAASLLAIPAMIAAHDPWPRIVLIAGTILVLLSAHAVLLRRGCVRISAAVFGLVAWLLLAAVNFTAGGVAAPGYSSHLILIISLGFVLGARGAFGTAAASTLLGLGFLALQRRGQMPEPQVANTPERYWFIVSMNFAAAAAVLSLMVKRFRRIIEDGRRELVERQEAERKLERHQAALEQTVRERTADLEHDRDFIRDVMETSPAGILTLDTGGRIRFANAAAGRILGLDREKVTRAGIDPPRWCAADRQGRALPGEPPPFSQVLAGGAPMRDAHVAVATGDGGNLLLSVNATSFVDRGGKAGGVIVTLDDVTERSRTEEELLKAHKLESVGVLAGGIAHDFNNMLAVVLGNISLARLELGPGQAAMRDLEQAEAAILQARELTQQLLTFARGGAPVLQVVDVGEVARRSCQFSLRGTNVRAEFAIPAGLRSVRGDEGQISQVVHNLALNACQAMPDGGVLRLSAENVAIGPGSGLPLPSGDYVLIRVSDEGAGIPPAVLPRIFDPYFTTKSDGTGLGLAVVYSVVRNHGGHVAVESPPGRGATFSVYLAAAASARPAAPAPEPARPGRGRILVMDDEPQIRALLGRMLAGLGFSAETTADGAAAVEAYRAALAAGRRFDAVLLDLTVPGGIGGAETMRRLLAIDPAVRAVVSSGYSNDPVMAGYAEHGFCGVIAKPYRPADLSRVLREALG